MRGFVLGLVAAGIAFSTANAQTDDQAAMLARQQQCGAEWRIAKDGNAIAAGVTWPQFWAQCNERLKAGIATSANHEADGATSDASIYYVTNTKPPDAFLSLRTDPASKIGQRIMTMPNGTRLQVLQRRADGWWYVKVIPTGQEGWALSGQGNSVWIECCATKPLNGTDPGSDPAKTAAPLNARDPADNNYSASGRANHTFGTSDITKLKRGTFVNVGTTCGAASNSTIMNFDGREFTQGRFCPAPVGDLSGSTLIIKRDCSKEYDRDNPQVDTFVIKSANEFARKNEFGEQSFRYCEQAALPEIWRTTNSGKEAVAANNGNESVAAALRSQMQHGDKLIMRDGVIVDGQALQNWTDPVYGIGGETLLKYDNTKNQWMIVDTDGGGLDIARLVSKGVPESLAITLFTKLQELEAKRKNSRTTKVQNQPVANDGTAQANPNPQTQGRYNIMGVDLGADIGHAPPELKRYIQNVGPMYKLYVCRNTQGAQQISSFVSIPYVMANPCLTVLAVGPGLPDANRIAAILLTGFPIGEFQFIDNAVESLSKKFGPGVKANGHDAYGLALTWGIPVEAFSQAPFAEAALNPDTPQVRNFINKYAVKQFANAILSKNAVTADGTANVVWGTIIAVDFPLIDEINRAGAANQREQALRAQRQDLERARAQKPKF